MEINCIYISGHPISEMYVRLIEPSWDGYNFRPRKAVTPKDLVYRHELPFGIKKAGKIREFTLTEKAVWYSHYDLWKSCVRRNTPMVIIEHDSKLTAPLPKMPNTLKFLSYINRDFVDENGELYNNSPALAPGSGYYITPTAASILIAQAISSDVKQNSDGHLLSIGAELNPEYHRRMKRSNVDRVTDFMYIEQINNDQLNTIDHRRDQRKFIGVDYEDFDLSSVYGQE